MPLELNCVCCSQPFYCHPSEVANGRKYCSIACRGAHLHRKSTPAESRTPVHFACKNCNKDFVMMQSYLTAYRKKFKHDPFYCSLACSNEGRRKSADERNRFVCQHCGKIEIRSRKTAAFRIYRAQKYCSVTCKAASQEQRALERFNGGVIGRHVKRNGYVWMSIPALANGGKKTEMLEHRYVMSRHLGRELLPEETVHHIDGIRSHNDITNLELFSSRHGPGQRVTDKVTFAIEILTLYPECASQNRASG